MGERVVAITGASGGIGAAAALELASRGTRLVLVARREAELRAVADRCGGLAVPITADATDRAAVRRVVAEGLERLGRIDAWVNNVGRGISRAPSQLTDDDIDAMMRVNVLSALYGMQEILPHFKARGEGHLVNISSMLGRIPAAVPRAAYCAAKHFLNALTATMRTEVQATHPGIRFSLVSPGVVFTDFGRNAIHGGPDSRQIPGGQEPAEVARVIADVIEDRREDVYTRAGSHDRVVAYFDGLGQDP